MDRKSNCPNCGMRQTQHSRLPMTLVAQDVAPLKEKDEVSYRVMLLGQDKIY